MKIIEIIAENTGFDQTSVMLLLFTSFAFTIIGLTVGFILKSISDKEQKLFKAIEKEIEAGRNLKKMLKDANG